MILIFFVILKSMAGFLYYLLFLVILTLFKYLIYINPKDCHRHIAYYKMYAKATNGFFFQKNSLIFESPLLPYETHSVIVFKTIYKRRLYLLDVCIVACFRYVYATIFVANAHGFMPLLSLLFVRQLNLEKSFKLLN